MKRNKNVWLIILIVVLIAATGMIKGNLFQEETEEFLVTEEEGNLEVHFLDVGQGDSTLIIQGQHAMLVDGGDNLHGWQVARYLSYLEIDHLDYVIATHPDMDHIGGLDIVLQNISCDTVLMPEYERDTYSYRGLMQVLEEKNLKPIQPEAGAVYELGTAEFTILAPLDEYEEVNDNSIAFRLVHGKNRFLFTGDAEHAAEADMIKAGRILSADVYKVAHHGSRGTNTELFMLSVRPKYAVISCGAGNDYGHPHSRVLNLLRLLRAKVFRTDEQGTIVAFSDGEKVTFNMSPSESWQSGD